MGKLVIIESPYRGIDYRQLELNLRYARACMRDSFLRGEFPFASHLLYTQSGILEDKTLHERELGISAGLAWGAKAELTAVYLDLITDWKHFIGIVRGIQNARENDRPVEFRNLQDSILEGLDSDITKNRKQKDVLIEELAIFLETVK